MQNLHRHSSYSNIYTADSAAKNEDYAKRAVELGHKVLSSVEHGFQGYYFETYELAKKYNLKCVIGAEVYWVKDRLKEYDTGSVDKNGVSILKKDRSVNHILLLAKNNHGRECINDILSEANISGYYYKPRVDLELLLSLPPNDVMVTTACIAFSGYDDIDDIILQLYTHFKDNFYLEIQYHNTERNNAWCRHLKEIHKKYGIKLIVGLDSHYIYPEQSKERDYVLEAKNINYEDEIGWYMDYPSDEVTIERFLEQNIFDYDEIIEAMKAPDVALTFDDYDDVPIFNKDIKLPTLFVGETKEQKDKRYSRLITKLFKEYMKKIPPEEYDRYFEGVKMEVQTYKDTGMCDYPLLDYAIVKDAVEHGGLITSTGRGSAVGYFTNTLCGFSKVNRFTSAIKLYPERFISTTRILETHSLPDIDLNVGTPEIFEESQVRVLGEEHVAPMIAFGTFKLKSAFKLYARAMNMEFSLANEISDQIKKYERALKEAEDDEEIDIYDYVDNQYKDYIENSKAYLGIISDKKKAPSAYLLYQGNIRREIGLIKCKSESSNKEYITCVIDGAIAENYKFLKNDILKVDVVLLIDKVFKRIGIEQFDVDTLIEKTKNDEKVWDIYANGYTIGLNQVEQDGTKERIKKYKPKNISELTAFVAAIRPGFKSMYSTFEKREDFQYGIKALDNLLQTEEFPQSFPIYQEQIMSILNYAGFPLDQCYGIIKAIAKKHPEKVKPLKEQFLEGFKKRIVVDEDIDVEQATNYADRVWTVVNDNCGYGYNSAHALSVALDSLYQAWQKANYPYEFYEVLLQHYSDKGNKDKVNLLKVEMKKAFGINEGQYKFRNDNRKFVTDKEHHVINPSLSSIKNFGNVVADSLYEMKDEKYNDAIDLFIGLEKHGVKSNHIIKLICIDYFSEFGEINQLLKQYELYNRIYGKKQFKKEKLEELEIPEYIIKRHAKKETEKQYREFDSLELLKDVCDNYQYDNTGILDKINYEKENLGYISLTVPAMSSEYYYVTNISGYSNNIITIYCLKDGTEQKVKVRAKTLKKNPLIVGKIIKVSEIIEDYKWKKTDDGFERSTDKELVMTKYTVLQ